MDRILTTALQNCYIFQKSHLIISKFYVSRESFWISKIFIVCHGQTMVPVSPRESLGRHLGANGFLKLYKIV